MKTEGLPTPRVFGMVTTAVSGRYTRVALDSFFRCTTLRPEDHFFLIDNDKSPDAPALAAQFPRVSLLGNARPLSYSQNANHVIGLASQDDADAYYLNNDVVFTPDWDIPVGREIHGIIGPTGNQDHQLKSTTSDFTLKPVMTLEDYLGHESELLTMVNTHCAANHRYIVAYKTNFFCIRIPRAVYRAVGRFDTSFGMAGGEDDDYCVRAYLKGFSVVVAEHAFVLHFGGRSTWSGTESMEQWRAREANFIRVFEQKWGRLISRLLLYKDRTLFEEFPDLNEIQDKGGLRALFLELLNRDGRTVDPELI